MTAKYKLPVPCKLQPGESLPGLLSRAVIKNHYPSIPLIAEWFGMSAYLSSINKHEMRHLASGRVDVKKLASFTEHSVDQIMDAALTIDPPRPGCRYDEYISIQYWRYCPDCIKAGKSHQKVWLLPFVTACPEHRCQLVDACQKCGTHTFSYVPLTPYCRACQSFTRSSLAHEYEIECSSMLHSLLEIPIQLKSQLDRLMTAWYLSTSEALRPHYRLSPQLQSVTAMRSLVIRIWRSIATDHGLADAINTQVKDLEQQWPHFPTAGSLLTDRAKEIGAVLPARSNAGTRIDLLQNDDPWWVPIHVASAAAGTSSYVLKRLADRGMVEAKLFTAITDEGRRHKFRMVKLDDWHRLIKEIFSLAIPVDSPTNLSKLQAFPLHEIIDDLRAGNMSVYRNGGHTLEDLYVSFSETQFADRRQQKPDGTLTATETTDLLKTYHAVVASLVSKKILATHRLSTKARLFIDENSANAFNDEYILIGTLGRSLNINPTNLTEQLQALGIMPANRDPLVPFFRRSEIPIDIYDRVASLSYYKTNVGRKSIVDPEKISDPKVKKLIDLVGDHGGASIFCRKFGVSNGNLSLILREEKSFGPLAAKRMEIRCGLAPGYISV